MCNNSIKALHNNEAIQRLREQIKLAQDRIDLIEAFQAGREDIESRLRHGPSSSWSPTLTPVWNWDLYEYRAKPRPKVFYQLYAPNHRHVLQFETVPEVIEYLHRDDARGVKLSCPAQPKETELEHALRATGFRLEKYIQALD